MGFTQWAESQGGNFSPVGETTPSIRPGYYDLTTDQAGQIYFVPIRARDDSLLHFSKSTT